MRKSRFTEERKLSVVREVSADVNVSELSRRHGLSVATWYNWFSRYAGAGPPELARLRASESGNTSLKRLPADILMEMSRFVFFWRRISERAGVLSSGWRVAAPVVCLALAWWFAALGVFPRRSRGRRGWREVVRRVRCVSGVVSGLRFRFLCDIGGAGLCRRRWSVMNGEVRDAWFSFHG